MAKIIKNIKDIYDHYGHKETRLHYHVILVTKYRRKLFHIEGLLNEALKECESKSHLKIHVTGYDKDHIHLLISIPPQYSISQTIKRIKQFTTNYLYNHCEEYLRSYYWRSKRMLWSDSYMLLETIFLIKGMLKIQFIPSTKGVGVFLHLSHNIQITIFHQFV